MVWPPQSPDLSPIEKVWDYLDIQVRARNPTNVKQLWQYLQEEWGQINSDYLLKLLNRMPKICNAVIKAKGGYFDENSV